MNVVEVGMKPMLLAESLSHAIDDAWLIRLFLPTIGSDRSEATRSQLITSNVDNIKKNWFRIGYSFEIALLHRFSLTLYSSFWIRTAAAGWSILLGNYEKHFCVCDPFYCPDVCNSSVPKSSRLVYATMVEFLEPSLNNTCFHLRMLILSREN